MPSEPVMSSEPNRQIFLCLKTAMNFCEAKYFKEVPILELKSHLFLMANPLRLSYSPSQFQSFKSFNQTGCVI